LDQQFVESGVKKQVSVWFVPNMHGTEFSERFGFAEIQCKLSKEGRGRRYEIKT